MGFHISFRVAYFLVLKRIALIFYRNCIEAFLQPYFSFDLLNSSILIFVFNFLSRCLFAEFLTCIVCWFPSLTTCILLDLLEYCYSHSFKYFSNISSISHPLGPDIKKIIVLPPEHYMLTVVPLVDQLSSLLSNRNFHGLKVLSLKVCFQVSAVCTSFVHDSSGGRHPRAPFILSRDMQIQVVVARLQQCGLRSRARVCGHLPP